VGRGNFYLPTLALAELGGAHYYNPKISLWLSVDRYAEKYLGFTLYNFVLNNPLLLIDSSGDTVDAANQGSFNNLVSIVSDKNKSRVTQEGGRLSVYVDGLTQSEIENDKGLHILYEASIAEEKILCTMGELEVFGNKDPNNGSYMHTVGLDGNGVINASRNGKDSNGGYTVMPRDGYDSQLAISGEGSWEMNGGGRKSIIFHEFTEAFYRAKGIDFGYPYDPSDNGAHNRATRRDRSHFGNNNPGQIIRYNKPVCTKVRKAIMNFIIKSYIR